MFAGLEQSDEDSVTASANVLVVVESALDTLSAQSAPQLAPKTTCSSAIKSDCVNKHDTR
jgi:hypothetical protein